MRSNFTLREHTYRQVKARWGLGAQAAQHVIKKTCDAYAVLKANLGGGRETGQAGLETLPQGDGETGRLPPGRGAAL